MFYRQNRYADFGKSGSPAREQRKPLSSGHTFANSREQAGGQAGLHARSQTDRWADYFENCNPGSFRLPFFRRNRSWFEPVIVTSPSIFWPSLRVRTSSFPCWV